MKGLFPASSSFSTFFYFGILMVGIAGCDRDTESALVITGSSTIAPMMVELAARYEQLHPGVRIDVQSGGSSRGIQDARRGLADAGMVSRAIRADEDLNPFLLAYDGIALIVHRDNPVKALTEEQIASLYTGQLRNWLLVGGEDRQVTVINKAAGRSTLELFVEFFALDNAEIRADIVAGENQQVIQTVAGNRAAIGYVSIGSAEYEVKAGVPIRILPLQGVSATTANVRNGEYPLRRELNLVMTGVSSPLLQDFLRFCQSMEAARIIEEHFFVPAKT